MSVFLILLLLVFFCGLRPRKEEGDYLNKTVTSSFNGLLALIIFCSHFFGYIDTSNLNTIDQPLFFLTNHLGQLMVSPFLFFSGFGIYESFKKKGSDYSKTMPKNRLLKTYLSFFLAWVLYACLALFLRTNYSISDYLLSLIGVRTIGNSAWYVVVILLLYLGSFVSFELFGNNKKALVFFHLVFISALYAIFYLLAPGPWWYNTLVCYLFGFLYSFFKEEVDIFLAKNKRNGWLFLLGSVVGFLIFYIFYLKFPVPGLSHILYIATNLFFCLSIVAFLFLFRIKSKLLLFLGRYCFWIYILQRLPMIALSRSSLVSGNRYVFFVLSLLATLILAFAIGKAFNYVWRIIFLREQKIGEVTNSRVGIVISYVSLVFSIIGAFVVTPRLLEWLGDTQYGLRSFATSLSTWLTVISSALAVSYLRFINLSNEENGLGEGKTNSLYLKVFILASLAVVVLTVLGTAVSLVFGVDFGNYTQEENRLIVYLILVSGINVAIQIASAVFTHYLTYKREFIFIRGLAFVVTIFTFAFELIFVYITRSVMAVVVVSLILTLVSAVANAFFAISVKKMPLERVSFKESSGLLKSIIIFSSFILLNAVVDQINHQVDITILGFMTNAERVTDYTLARYFTTYMMSLSIAISGTYAPKVHELVKKKDTALINELFQRVSKTQLIILTLVVGGFAACGHSFMYIWIGDQKEYVYYYSLVLLSLNVIPLSCNLGIEVQRAMNKHKFRAILYTVFALLNIGVSILLIAILPADMAIWGAIFGTVFSIVLGNIVILSIYNHVVVKLDMARYFLNVLRYVAIAGLAVLPCVILSLHFSDDLSHISMFLINGSLFVFIFGTELLIIDRKTIIPFVRKAIDKILGSA